MFKPTLPHSLITRRIGASVAAVCVMATSLVAVSSAPAEAGYSDCGRGFHCWYPRDNGGGNKKPVASDNSDLTRFDILTRSGFNNGTSGQQNCGYYSTGFDGGTATKTYRGMSHNYSQRRIKSNLWMREGAACS